MIKEEILAKLKSGSRVKVYEAGSSAPFTGLLIARKHGAEPGATFTVRAVVAGVGVEKIYPIYSPLITKVEIVSTKKKVHRAKLYWVRGASAARQRQKLGVSV